YMIVDDSLRPTPDGFEVDIRITYYRGLGLSMIEAFEVTVDGDPVPRKDIRFVLRGTAYTHDEMEREGDVRWEFGEIATLSVRRPGGLAAGVHAIRVAQQLRVSYMPDPLRGQDEKNLVLAA
ncbi:MAG: hypothetical protein J2P57_25775, partial [Acidimicrobiaceae bacterium]|nr:hypothetical protein [Acidimicrobiaceae bacterium]